MRYVEYLESYDACMSSCTRTHDSGLAPVPRGLLSATQLRFPAPPGWLPLPTAAAIGTNGATCNAPVGLITSRGISALSKDLGLPTGCWPPLKRLSPLPLVLLLPLSRRPLLPPLCPSGPESWLRVCRRLLSVDALPPSPEAVPLAG